MQDLRTTTGQRVSVTYNPQSNTLTFREEDWFADPLRSTGVPVKSRIVRRLGAGNVTQMLAGRKPRSASPKAA